MDMSGKRVLITGSTTGIGQGAAEMFRAAGARVAINGRDPANVAARNRRDGRRRLRRGAGHVGSVESCRRIVETAVAVARAASTAS